MLDGESHLIRNLGEKNRVDSSNGKMAPYTNSYIFYKWRHCFLFHLPTNFYYVLNSNAANNCPLFAHMRLKSMSIAGALQSDSLDI